MRVFCKLVDEGIQPFWDDSAGNKQVIHIIIYSKQTKLLEISVLSIYVCLQYIVQLKCI